MNKKSNCTVVANALSWKAKNSEPVARNDGISLEELLKQNGLSMDDFKKMESEMRSKGARAVRFMRGQGGRLVYKADGLTR